jgi:hypothetical protein
MLGRVEVNPAELRVGLLKDRFIELGAVEHRAGGHFLPVSGAARSGDEGYERA